MSFIQKNVKGILLCLVLAIPCWFLGQTVPVVGGPVFGILAGMLITLLLKDKTQFRQNLHVGRCRFLDLRRLRNRCNSPCYRCGR